jgi:hypothetical protein
MCHDYVKLLIKHTTRVSFVRAGNSTAVRLPAGPVPVGVALEAQEVNIRVRRMIVVEIFLLMVSFNDRY